MFGVLVNIELQKLAQQGAPTPPKDEQGNPIELPEIDFTKKNKKKPPTVKETVK